MRTDSTKYASEFISHCRNYIVEKYEDAYLGNTNMIINTNKNDPHEAIRVTNIKKEFLDINVKDKRAKTLYKIIWKNTIQSCMSAYKSHIYKYLITAPNDLYYEYKNEIPTFLGWKILDDKVDAVNLSTYFKTLLNKPIQYNEIYNEICINKSVHYYTESSLIHKLETLGIGRPSTFSTIVNTNIERKYIDKTDIPGTNVEYNKYLLKKDILNVNVETKQLGGEKNKLKITNLGVLCLEFLDKMFENIFSYDYTSNMETLLDNISNGSEEQWHNICDECYKEISAQLKTGNKVEKLEYPLNKGYIFLFEKYGPVLKKIDEDNTVTYVNVRKDIDIDIGKLINNEYDVDDLMFNNNNIGTYNDNPICINQGPYGYYLECGNIKKTLKNYKGDINNIKQDDAIKILSEEANNSNILLELTSNLSIRKGKYGAYAFYKTPSMKKPDFLNIKKMSKGFSTASKNEIIDWICDKYNLNKNNI
jgi:DNA topoisomerase-1